MKDKIDTLLKELICCDLSTEVGVGKAKEKSGLP